MEPAIGWRHGKLIWALEAHYRHERLVCSECNDKLRARRGCRRPPHCFPPGDMVFRTSSPMLEGDASMLHECPVGKVQREAPHLFDAILAHGMSEGAGLQLLRESRWLQQAFRVIGSEKERHRLITDRERQAKRDAEHGRRVLTRR